jgi:signal transduction histidine kinase/ligand-binding sensor domain-containing protein
MWMLAWLPTGVAIASVTTVHVSADIGTGVGAAKVAAGVVNIPVVEGGSARFTRMSTADGLSQTRVSQIVEDDRGFIWFGTQYGIDRYDGYEFKVFVHEAGRVNSLAGAYVYSLFKDRSGMLWIGCNRVLDRFDPRTETFTHYRVETDELTNLGSTVVHISQDRSGLLWLATGTGLHQLDPNTGKIVHYRHSVNNPGGLSTNDITWSGEDRNGDFWVGTADGLDKFDRATGQVLLHIPIPDPIQVAFFEDRFGQFWIYHEFGGGLALYDRASNTLTKYSFYGQEPSPDAMTGVTGMIEDHNGNLWLGSPGMGLLQFDRDQRRFIRYRNRPGDPQSIGEDKVIALFLGRQGNIWIGLHSVGPNHFSPDKAAFEVFKHQADDPNSLSVDFVNAILADSRGSLWLANDDGVNRLDRKTGKLTGIAVGIGTKPMIIYIMEDRSGMLWFGTYGRGLYSYDPNSGRSKSYRHNSADPTSLSSDIVWGTFEDHAGNLWVGTTDGLDLLDRDKQNFHVYRPELNGGLKQVYVRIAEDEKGTLWLGTLQSGLQHFDPVTHRFTVYKSNPSDPSALRDDSVGAVYVASTHLIWIGTGNGLNRFDPATGKFAAYDSHNGLSGNLIDCILEDDRGYLWMNTNKGLSKFNPMSGTFANYSDVDGLPGTDLTGWAACSKSRRGELFFAGFAGAVGFFPDKVEEGVPFSPQVVLTDLELSGAPATIGAGGPLTQSIAYTDRIVLPHELNIFSLTFAGLRYFSPESNRYRYKLEGLDRNWYEVGSNNRRATYTTLPAGSYTFRVQAATARGAWSDPGTSLQVVILPAWWATWWFRTGYVTLFALAIWGAYLVRVRQLSRQLMMRMQERVNERTRIARDLHDTLLQGLVSASLQLEVADTKLSAQSGAKPLIERISALLRQMIDESRNTLRGLRVGQPSDDLERAIALVPHELGVDGTVEFHLLGEGNRRSLRPAIREELYWIAREALANAFRHSRASVIDVVLVYSRKRFQLVIRDDGCGISPATLQAGSADHWGLSGMKERSARIGAKLSISSATDAGTEVDITIPGHVAFEPPSWTGRRVHSEAR